MKIVIAGAGGYASALLGYVKDMADGKGFEIVGYVSPNPSGLEAFNGTAWLGAEFTNDILFDSHVIVGIGDGAIRERVFNEVKQKGGRLIGLIHPKAYVAPSARIHSTVIVGPLAFVEAGADIKEGVVLTHLVSIGHDSVVGAFCQFSPFSGIMGRAKIGEKVFFAPNAIVSPRVSVGSRSKLATGAVLSADCPDGSLMIGNPAKGRVMFR
jgi:sugar O-acyltransferase (sialic acid O-acetyltransferase NeuD family)